MSFESNSVYVAAPVLNSSAHGLVPATSNWSSNECDCSRDWETCWWGAWCCCLLSNRTAGTFKKDGFWGGFLFAIAILVSLLVLPINSLVSIFFIVVAAIVYAAYRAYMRDEIRRELGIPGSICLDFFNHCCIPCCTVCQEAREAKTRCVFLIERYFNFDGLCIHTIQKNMNIFK